MDLRLQGKTAVVTGGTAGIGLAIVRALATEGVDVAVSGRTRQKLDEVFDKEGLTVRKIVADAGTAEGVAALIAAVPETSILINNLGIYEPKPFTDIPDEEWFHIFEVNVMSGVRLARYYLPRMLEKNDNGRILFISSDSGVMPHPAMMHYAITKAAQISLGRAMAEMTRNTTVTVNTLLPGTTKSEGLTHFMKTIASNKEGTQEEAEREFFEKYRPTSLLQRTIESDEIASFATYLASPRSAATNGAALRAEGGVVQSLL